MSRRALSLASATFLLSASAFAQAPGAAALATETTIKTPVGTQRADSTAVAPTWTEAFPAEAVASYLSPKIRILVVSAGEERAKSKAASDALLRVLRASDRVQLAMPDSGLGALDGLSDEQIVAKAKVLPVDLVSIVRAFTSSEGSTAVVTHYARENGEFAFAWSAAPTAPLQARESGDTVSGGVRAQAVEQVAAVAKESVKGEGVSKAEYDAKFIGYDDYLLVAQQGWGSARQVGQGTRFYVGQYKKDLPLPDLFTLVERQDLRATYDQNMTLKVLSIVAGTGALGASFLPLMMDAPSGDMTPLYLSLGLITGGSVLLLVGLFVDPNPVPMHEVRALADGYNRKLRGEEPAVAGDKVSAVNFTDVTVGFAPVDGGAIAGVSGRF